MPELPEVESLRRSLTPVIIGKTVRRVTVLRPDIVYGSAKPAHLLAGARITRLTRHGKQLAICGADGNGRCPGVCVHLGMSGSMRYRPPGDQRPPYDPHVHVIWYLDDRSRLEFRDPRRFGGLWGCGDADRLIGERWSRLGDDALRVRPAALHRRLSGTHRSIKAALLDQSLLAGLGNIYVDELLFACRLHPLTPANRLTLSGVQMLVRRTRRLLRTAIGAGGSTLRDYTDAAGQPGWFQTTHKVYGRAGQPCRSCRQPLDCLKVAGRTTVWCRWCQLPTNPRLCR